MNACISLISSMSPCDVLYVCITAPRTRLCSYNCCCVREEGINLRLERERERQQKQFSVPTIFSGLSEVTHDIVSLLFMFVAADCTGFQQINIATPQPNPIFVWIAWHSVITMLARRTVAHQSRASGRTQRALALLQGTPLGTFNCPARTDCKNSPFVSVFGLIRNIRSRRLGETFRILLKIPVSPFNSIE